MKTFSLACLICIHLFLEAHSQCSDPVFNLEAQACMLQRLQVSNQSPDLTADFVWDFCANDLNSTPLASEVVSGSGLPFKVEVVKEGDLFYGFYLSRTDRKLYRLDFGDKLSNKPTATDLGDLGLNSNQLLTIEIHKEAGLFYGLFIDFNASKVYRIDFGSTINSNPQNPIDLGGFGFVNQPIDLVIQSNGGNLYAFIANYSNGKIVRLNFGNSILNGATASSFDIPGAAQIAGLSIQKYCNYWYGVVTSSGSGKISKINFGSSIENDVPAIEDLVLSASITGPAGIAFAREGEHHYCFVQGLGTSGNIYKIQFSSIDNKNVSVTNMGNLGVIGSSWAISVYEDRGKWIGFSSGNTSPGIINSILFEGDCGVSPDWFSGAQPPVISYTSSGIKHISLTSTKLEAVVSRTETILVDNLIAPDITFQVEGVCAEYPSLFTPENTSGDIDNFQWDFGNTQSSIQESPSTVYNNAGLYLVHLEVEGTNGCQNFSDRTLTIYAVPLASFNPPPGLICTNNEFTFLNTTVDNFDGNLTYQWLVDNVPTSTDRDLLYAFSTGGNKEIKLQTAIPGCSSEAIQVLSGVQEGPIVDFTVEGVCLNETIQLTNASQGDIASYAWEFGDGQASTETSPSIEYTAIGEYTISLETLGNNGCVSTKSVDHQIFSIPQPNFNIDLPPFSCSGSPTQFNDLTPVLVDSNVESWLWEFNDGDATATSQSPTHTYELSGAYDVKLTVTSDQGCLGELLKSIRISESPQPVISNTPACVNTGVELMTSSAIPITTWQWQIENNYYYTEMPSHVFDAAGDYSVNLLVTGENGCLGSSFKDIHVPLPLMVDFTSTKKCVDTEAEFLATTSDSPDDLPLTYTWLVEGIEKQGQIMSHSFTAADLYEVLLKVTTESGCTYSLNKAQTVVEGPQANFAFTPNAGPPPLSVQFTNQSTNAVGYLWRFNDSAGSTSVSTSPAFTFTEIGDYPVDLIATNEEGCESTVSKLVEVAVPVLFVSLDEFEVIENQNGLLQMRVTLNNLGNVDIQNLPLSVSLSNGTELYETISEILPGGELSTVLLTTAISRTPGLQFLCLNLKLNNNSAGATEELCVALEENTVFTSPYPNPAKDVVKLEWIAAQAENLSLSVVNTLGKEMLSISFAGQQGLNSHTLSTQLWQEGLYFIKVQSPSVERTFRIIIVR